MNNKFRNLKAIVFDFDGTILDSNMIKEEAFYQVYLKYGENVALLGRKYHRDNLGLNRLEKFRFVINNYTGIEYNENLGQNLSIEFSKIVLGKMMECDYIEYALGFLTNHHKKFLFFISSAMPEIELYEIIRFKEINHYFIEVKGYPTEKAAFTSELIKKHNLKLEEIVFVGDSQSDYEAAKVNSIDFIFLGDSKIVGSDYESVKNFYDLESILGV